MKQMITVLVPVLILLSLFRAHGAGILMNANQSAEWCKTLNRLASIDPDATYYNPAGTAFLEQGVYMYLSDQVIYQPIRVDTKRSAATGLSRARYPGEKNSWYLLNGYLLVKYRRLALSGAGLGFGSGGKAVFNRGLQELDILAGAPYGAGAALNGLYARLGLGGPAGNPTIPFSKFSGVFTIYAVQANVAYEAVPGVLAFSLGFRFYLGEATYDAKLYAPGPGAAFGGYIPGGSDLHAHQQGISAGIVAGVCARPVKGLVIGLTGEWNSPFRLDTKAHDDFMIMLLDYRFKKNRKIDAQLPASMGMGVSYRFAGAARVSASFAYSFNQFAQMKGRERGYTGGIDTGIGFDYTFEPIMLNIGAGYLYSTTGARPSAQSQRDDGLDSHSVSLGLSMYIGAGMSLTVAETYTYYIPANVNRGQNNILRLLPAIVHRQSFNTAVGLTSKFAF